METKIKKESIKAEAIDQYPGVAIDAADKEKVDESLVEERTDVLDSNPRDNDL